MNDKLNEAILQYSNWFTLSSKEIDTLKADLVELQKGLNCSDAMAVLRNEITNLKNKVQLHLSGIFDKLTKTTRFLQLLSSEQKSLDLHSDVQVLTTLSQTAGQSLNNTRSNLVSLSDDLAQLYHLVCTVNGETPNRVLLDHKNDDLRFVVPLVSISYFTLIMIFILQTASTTTPCRRSSRSLNPTS